MSNIGNVHIRPARSVETGLIPCDSRGNPIELLSAVYSGPLPADGLPSKIIFGNEKCMATYTHQQVYQCNAHIAAAALSREKHALKIADQHKDALAAFLRSPTYMYRDTWIVRAAVKLAGICAWRKRESVNAS